MLHSNVLFIRWYQLCLPAPVIGGIQTKAVANKVQHIGLSSAAWNKIHTCMFTQTNLPTIVLECCTEAHDQTIQVWDASLLPEPYGVVMSATLTHTWDFVQFTILISMFIWKKSLLCDKQDTCLFPQEIWILISYFSLKYFVLNIILFFMIYIFWISWMDTSLL